jgi:hypothetical protein
MSRYAYGGHGFEFVFWTGVQDSEDILKFSKETEVDNDREEDIDGAEQIYAVSKFEDLYNTEKYVELLKNAFLEKFEMSYRAFMKIIDLKGYTSSSNDSETKTEEWRKMCKAASSIELGSKIVAHIKRYNEDLYLEVEL